MITEQYLGRSQLFRCMKRGQHGQLVELYAARLVKDGLGFYSTRRSLSVVNGFLSWLTSSRYKLNDLDEHVLEQYIKQLAQKKSIQLGDRAALKRLLLTLRETHSIPLASLPPILPQDQICEKFADYLQQERGLAPKSITQHLSGIRRFLSEVCPGGVGDLDKIQQEDVIRYVERHARDGSPASGKGMCWSLRTFFRYLYYNGSNSHALANCVPSIRQWKLAGLPTYLTAAQVQKVLDACDRTTACGRRDYAIIMLLAKLGLRANEVATVTLDDIEWRSGTMLIRAKGRQ